jgi:flagellar hook-associated protein 3 FlgL
MTTAISTSTMSALTQMSVVRLQARLGTAQGELASGRMANIGLAIGAQLGLSVSLRQTLDTLSAFSSSNAVVSTRLDATQVALTSIAATGSGVASSLFTTLTTGTSASVLRQSASQALSGIADILNSSTGGDYLFSGENSSVKPLQSFDQTPPSSARQALADAFRSAFGVAAGSPGAATITPERMTHFLDNQFAVQFDDAHWKANWSAAGDHALQSQVSTNEIVASSVTANEPAVRNIASALSMLAGLGIDTLNAETRKTVIGAAERTLQTGMTGIAELQSSVGVTQNTVSDARDRMTRAASLLTSRVSDLESVDPAQLAIEINSLKTLLEATYSLTAQLQNLSLVKYL